MNKRGQAMTEMVIILPLFLMVTCGVMAVVYACWQGVKVQQAANLAARIQGQERVAGGYNVSVIQEDNGVQAGGDLDPTRRTIALDAAGAQVIEQSNKHRPSTHTVYGKIVQEVRAMFGAGDQDGLLIPLPSYGLVGYSDQVKVVRVWTPPQLFGLSLNPVQLVATAYGGEDSHMYSLPRWGSTSGPQAASNSGRKISRPPHQPPQPQTRLNI